MQTRQHQLLLAGAIAVWLGSWGAWTTHPAAGLTHNPFGLAQTAQRLPEVVFGRLNLMPDLLRASLGLAALTLSLAATRIQSRPVRWGVRLLALTLALRLWPPYPDVLALWRSPDYGRLFVIASVVMLAWLLITLFGMRWPGKTRFTAMLIIGLLGLVGSLLAAFTLQRSLAANTALGFSLGWGLVLYVAGLLLIYLTFLWDVDSQEVTQHK